jgi:hypothetical protein
LGYIEAQALTGNLETAQKLSNTVFAQDNRIRKGLCEVWKRVQAQGVALSESKGPVRSDRVNQMDQALTEFQCVNE